MSKSNSLIYLQPAMVRGLLFVFALMLSFSVSTKLNAQDDKRKKSASSETLTVLSYNIHMWQIGVDALAEIIRKSGADIVGLNEAWNGSRNEQIAKKLGYNIVYGGQNPKQKYKPKAHTINGFYMPQVLLTKHKIISSKVFNAMAAKEHKAFDPDVPIYRGGTMAVLETAQGNRFVVFVLHLHPWGDGNNKKMTTMRYKEIAGIVKKLEPYQKLPRIILGDFNTRSHFDETGGWRVTRFLEKSGYTDLYRTVHRDAKAKPGLTCGDGRIDYIFYSKHFSPIKCQVVTDSVFGSKGYKQSDHLAVCGSLKLDKQKSSPNKKR